MVDKIRELYDLVPFLISIAELQENIRQIMRFRNYMLPLYVVRVDYQ